MTDEHKQQAAVLLTRAYDGSFEEGLVLALEALVHAVLHLAEVVEVRETIGREQ